MNAKKILLIIIFIFSLQAFIASGQLTCRSMGISDPCFGANVLELNDVKDAHAARPGIGEFSYKICCSGATDLEVRLDTGDAFFLNLTADRDAHASRNDGVLSYPIKLYLNSSDDLNCGLVVSGVANACNTSGYNTCVVTLSAASDAHVSNCSYVADFQNQVCCSSTGGVGSANCQVTEVFWTDGYVQDLPEAVFGTQVGLALFATGDCSLTTADFTVRKINDAIINATPEQDFTSFTFDDTSGIWWTMGVWTVPVKDSAYANGDRYYFNAIVSDASGSYTVNNKDRNLTVLDAPSCGPPPPLPPECPICTVCSDPDAGCTTLLTAGQDIDCDGVDDCIDQCVGLNCDDDGFLNYVAAPSDNCNGIPPGTPGCTAFWDCSSAQWSDCFRDGNGDLVATRDINLCTFDSPGVRDFCIPPADKKTCVEEEEFPFFTNLNFLLVICLLVGFYAYKRKDYFL